MKCPNCDKVHDTPMCPQCGYVDNGYCESGEECASCPEKGGEFCPKTHAQKDIAIEGSYMVI